MRALIAGATGFIGTRLGATLAERGVDVRGLVRDPRRARHLEAVGVELWEGDVLEVETLRGAGEGVEVAYYLVHSMGRGAGGDFAARERTAAAALCAHGRRRGHRAGR